ncbi:hypothetical protein OCJ35_22035 [Pluralibacter gergoviae]|uniref:hypothetical protein n=1 Tax=Pluralibacter gergoviae TaxID=61647 RepID=UPI0021F44EEB|nr:hypothetical protein [Pluralibacter gergoviae]MCV7760768.1 hypothetical protein [Pluralibacter gergoviae]
MALPQHKYFTLEQAAVKVGCTYEDLIHFASIGMLQLCIKFPYYGFSTWEEDETSGDTEEVSHPGIQIMSSFDFDEYFKNRSAEDEKHDENPNAVHYLGGSYISDYIRVIEFFKTNGSGKVDHKLDGLLAIKQSDIYENEMDIINNKSESIYVFGFEVPRSKKFKQSDNYTLSGFETLEFEPVMININEMIITNEEIELLKSGGKQLESSTGINGAYVKMEDISEPVPMNYNVNRNKLGDLIEALIRSVPELGDRVINTSVNDRYNRIKNFFEEKHSEGLLIGIEPPSSATLERYFKI